MDIGALKAQFQVYCQGVATLIANYATLSGLGLIPAYPVEVIADADYNSVTTARATWTNNTNIAKDTIIGNHDTQIVNNIPATIALMGAGNNWIDLTADTPGDFAPYPNTVWIGYAPGLPVNGSSIVVSAIAPTQNFPLL